MSIKTSNTLLHRQNDHTTKYNGFTRRLLRAFCQTQELTQFKVRGRINLWKKWEVLRKVNNTIRHNNNLSLHENMIYSIYGLHFLVYKYNCSYFNAKFVFAFFLKIKSWYQTALKILYLYLLDQSCLHLTF